MSKSKIVAPNQASDTRVVPAGTTAWNRSWYYRKRSANWRNRHSGEVNKLPTRGSNPSKDDFERTFSHVYSDDKNVKEWKKLSERERHLKTGMLLMDARPKKKTWKK